MRKPQHMTALCQIRLLLAVNPGQTERPGIIIYNLVFLLLLWQDLLLPEAKVASAP